VKISDFIPPNPSETPGFPKDAKWLPVYLQSVFEHLKLLTQAMQGKLSSENSNDDTKTVFVRHGIPIEVTCKVKGRPTGASIIAFTDPCVLSEIQPIDVGKIRLTVSFDDAAPDERAVTILIKGS
jgi:hypothetical protein